MEKRSYVFKGEVEKFPNPGGWVYVAVPKEYAAELKSKRQTWGMYPVTAHIGNTSWRTKLMMKKGGDFFIALKEAVRSKENVIIGSVVDLSFTLD